MKNRSKVTLAFLCLSGLLYVCLFSAVSRAQSRTPARAEPLDQKVERLERQVTELKRQLAELKRERGSVTVTPYGQKEEGLPPGARPFHFNGMLYYVLPLKEGSGPSRVITAPVKPAK
jgi:hypothetical protein